MDLTVDVIRELRLLEALRAEWEQLWLRDAAATSFQHPCWLLPWCRGLLRGELCVLTVRREERLVALLPLFRWFDGEQPVLSLLGAGCSDYCGIIVEACEQADVMIALESWLACSSDWQRCEWSELHSDSPLRTLTPAGISARNEPQEVCPGLTLGTARTLRELLSVQRWAKLGQARRRALREASLCFEDASEQTLDELFDALTALHCARWGQQSQLSDPTSLAFHRAVVHGLFSQGSLSLFGLRRAGEWVGVIYGFRDHQADRYYMQAHDPQLGKLSLGTLLVARAIERALERNAVLLDFLRGDEPYKYAWGATDHTRLCRRVLTR